MEHRDQKHENHGVHVCNKCGWPFPNPHPSARHRRSHKKVCGQIEGYKSFQSEASTHLTVSDDDDDDDHRNSSPRVLGRNCDDKVIDGIGKKLKESEDEVFSDAAAEFSESVLGVGTNKPVGDTSDSVTTMKMVAKDGLIGSPTSKDREIDDVLNSDRVPSSSSSTENRKADNTEAAKISTDQSGSGSEIESKSNQESVTLETDFKTGELAIFLGDHMSVNSSDLYPVEPETVIAASQQERYNNSVENVPRCSLTSPDGRYNEEKNELSSLDSNLEITVSSGIDNDKYKVVPKIEEPIKMPTEPTIPDVTLLLTADNDISIHSEMTESDVASDVKSFDLNNITSDAGKEIQSSGSNNLLGTNKIEGIENVHLHCLSASGDLNVVDDPEVFVKDFMDHEVKSTDLEPCKGVSGQEDSVKDPIPEERYSTFQAKPFNQAIEVASIDMQAVDNRKKLESAGKKVPFDGEVDWSKNSVQEVNETPVQEVDAMTEGILCENEKKDNSQTLGDAATSVIDSVQSVCFSPEVVTIAPSQNSSLDNFTKNVTEVLCDENSRATPIGNQMTVNANEVGTAGGCLTEDDNKAGACGSNLEDSVQVHLPTDVCFNDISVCEKDKFDNPDIAQVECKKDSLEETNPIEVYSIPESTTNSLQNRCHTVAEGIVDRTSRRSSGTVSTDLGTFDINLSGVDTQQTVKVDDCDSAVHGDCISEVNDDDQLYHVRDFNSDQKTSEDHVNKEANLVSVNNESGIERTAIFPDSNVRQFVGDAVRISSETSHEEGGKDNIKQPQLISSLIDVSVDSFSQTDSLEGNWGSVSVLSTQSDLPAIVDAEVIPPHATPEAEETNLKKAEAAFESQRSDKSDKSDLFEPPSFMTLVEPGGGSIKDSAPLEIETAQNLQQPNPAYLQAAWFPSYTHVTNDSPGRKKNEAIIAKVTNWSTTKPHTALKNLLDDAALENKQKQKQPNPKEILASVIQKDEIMANNGSVATTVDSVIRRTSPGNREIAREWNSPARYPSDIKREKRKGKPYWAQFVCCSSVH